MSTQIFVNLPVKNLQRAVTFFTRLGYSFNPKFSDDNASCMIVSENIFVMLLVESFFKTFTKRTSVMPPGVQRFWCVCRATAAQT